MNMKTISCLLFLLGPFLYFAVNGCQSDQNRKRMEMITTRTLGLAYIEENKLEEAEAAFRKLINLAPREVLGYANLGLVYIRMGNYPEAEKYLRQALTIEEDDPEIRLNLAEILILTNRTDDAIQELSESLRHSPDHIRTLHKLGQLYARLPDSALRQQAEVLMGRVVEFLPANLVARLQLIELLLQQGKADTAAGYLEELRQQLPELPPEGEEFFDRSLDLMRQGKAREALPPFNIFHNVLKPTPLFRAGFDQLKGIGGPLIGTPILTFRQDVEISGPRPQDAQEVLTFTDATDLTGLSAVNASIAAGSFAIMALADFDGDGNQDLYISAWDPAQNAARRFLLYNDYGKFVDVTREAGIQHPGRDVSARFVDYDNDGYLDLYLVNTTANVLYYHFQPKKFQDVAPSAGITGEGTGLAACFGDFDHDGDLDLFQGNAGKNHFYRNNLDGTYTENAARMGVSGGNTRTRDMAIGDFDDDGDLDFFVVNEDASNILYTNLRQGQFDDITATSGLATGGNSRAVSAGDYNNDGWLDLLVVPVDDQPMVLYRNKGGNVFDRDLRSDTLLARLQGFNSYDARFLDFDNDGFLDVVLVGENLRTSGDTRHIFLFHNDGTGIYRDASSVLPPDLPPARQVAVADFNEDGDLDIFLSLMNGGVMLLRNDGGNANRYLKVRLVGLRTGSGKNNYFGIGAKIEVKAEGLFQSHMVSEPVSHFGLGQYARADVVRVLWTNGVPQNLFQPGSNQALLEKQILKGSCPFLYAWNGQQFEFVTDVLWRSALGMPLGIMGGETAYAFPDPSQDYFKIPGNMLREKEGNYTLQLTCELWETAFFDQVKLLVADHPAHSDIFVDERFLPPPYPPFEIYQVQEKLAPRSVRDHLGNDLLAEVMYPDDIFISNLKPDRYQGVTTVHDLIIDPGDLTGAESVFLFLKGWIFPTDASINMAIAQSSDLAVFPPALQVKDRQGEWQTVIDNIGFPMGKQKHVIIDMSGKFLCNDYQIRLRTNMQIYWDHIFFTTAKSDDSLRINTLYPGTANLHYRGFSAMYRKGGRYGPHWFDYQQVDTRPAWRDLEGSYTRYGEVGELLTEADGRYVIMNAGDEMTVQFNTEGIPSLPEGWTRDFIIYTDGWLKDGDLNTASGQTVSPLPFRGMTGYPYDREDGQPAGGDYQEFLQKYVHREVSTDEFRRFLRK